MLEPNLTETDSDLSNDDWSRVQLLVGEFRQQWQAATSPGSSGEVQPPNLNDFLARPDIDRRALLVQLVQADLEFQLRAGRDIKVEDYARRFSELAHDANVLIGLIAREFQLRREFQQPARLADFVTRFPEYRDELTLRLRRLAGDETHQSDDAPIVPSTDLQKFWADVANSNLIAGPLLEELRTELNINEQLLEPKDFAIEFVRRKLVTAWQARMLLSGRATFFLGRYKLLDVLGRGGMGTVFAAEHAAMGRRVAVKVMAKSLMKNAIAVSRFQREIQAAAALDHPNIVHALDADHVQDTHFLVTEFVHGEDLSTVIKRLRRLPVDWACELIRQAALGLQHAHEKGMVHRDIKPGNLLVSFPFEESSGTTHAGGVVKILDMGLARFTDDVAQVADLTSTDQIMGTPDYISPEQARRTKHADIRSDIYSLGCSLFHLLTGRVPFHGDSAMDRIVARMTEDAPTVASLCPEIPQAVCEVVAKMLAREPAHRFQTPGEVAAALAPFASLPNGFHECIQAAADDEHGATQADMLGKSPVGTGTSGMQDEALIEFLGSLSHVARADDDFADGDVPPRTAKFRHDVTHEITSQPSSSSRLNHLLHRRKRADKFRLMLWLVGGCLLVAVSIGYWAWERSQQTTLVLDWPNASRAGVVLTLDGIQTPVSKSGDLRFPLLKADRSVTLQRKGYKSIEGRWTLAPGESATLQVKWTPTDETRRKLALQELDEHISSAMKAADRLSHDDASIAKAYADSASLRQTWPGSKEDLLAATLIAKLPSPADTLDPSSIPPALLAAAREKMTAEDGERVPDLVAIFRHAEASPVTSVCFAPDGKTLFTAGMDQRVIAWDITTAEPSQEWNANVPVSSIAIHPAGRLLGVSGVSIRDTTRLWDVVTHEQAETEKPGQTSKSHAESSYSRDGLILVSTGHDPALIVHDGLTLRIIHSFAADEDELPQCAAVSSDGGLVALGLENRNRGMVKIWQTSDWRLLHDFYADAPPIYSLAFSPDSKTLVTGGPRGEIRLWDSKTAQRQKFWPGHANTSHVLDVEFSLDGQRMSSAATDGSVCVWDMDSVQPRTHKFFPIGESVSDISWSPCGRHVAVANVDGTAYMFRLKAWESGARPRRGS